MALTAAGHLLLAFADDANARLESIHGLMLEFETLQRGHVDVACVEGLLSAFMPEFVERLLGDYPGLSITVSALGSQEVAEAVAKHQADLGIVFGDSPRGDLLELALMSQPLCAIVGPHHVLARKRRCRLADVAAYPVVLPNRAFGIRQLIDRVRASQHLELRAVVETNTLAFAWRLVRGSDRVTFLPLDSVRAEVTEGALVAVPLDEPLLQATRVTLVASASRVPSAAATAALNCLTKMMARGEPARALPKLERSARKSVVSRRTTSR
jgi:DNA-binding transcriptional LysR family regulator